ncbi:MAG: DHH family phosphoesterase [Euryarchaeota archaeon]|nr:DHH family phosphoesterase [Euryarchaeota archaeon]
MSKIRALFSEADTFLLLVHKNADVDAVGSAIALKYYLQGQGKTVKIGCDSLSSQGKMFLETLKEEIDYYEFSEEFGNLVLLDTSSVKKLGIFEKAVEKADNVVVIDHHEKNKDLERFLYYNETRSSNTEIIYEYFPLDSEIYLKAVLGGIITDTGHFRHADADTFEAVHKILKKGVDLQEILRSLENKLDRSKKIAVLKASRRLELHYAKDLIVATTKIGAHESLAAKSLLFMGADVSFVANGDRISSRARHSAVEKGINLAEIMQDVGKVQNADGGGHKAAAGAEGLRDTEEAISMCVSLVKKRIDGNG